MHVKAQVRILKFALLPVEIRGTKIHHSTSCAWYWRRNSEGEKVPKNQPEQVGKLSGSHAVYMGG